MMEEKRNRIQEKYLLPIYNISMMVIILLSLIPLGFKEQTTTLIIIDKITVSIFIFDYLVRWGVHVRRERTVLSFFRYPFTIFAIIDLISILPSLCVISNSFKLFRLFRMFRALRIFRAFRLLRYSKNFIIVLNVFKKEKQALIAVGTMAIAYILISALAIFNVEPQTFGNFFDAFYWATVSLTTVGYGDLYPVSTVGRLIAMVSSFIGIAIVALPAGIMTAGYMEEVKAQGDVG